MNFTEIAQRRYSCRKYDPTREVEQEKIDAIVEAARLSPSACNGQPYHITVCKGEVAKKVAKAVGGMGMNEFAADAPVMLVMSEEPYVKLAALGAKNVILTGVSYQPATTGVVVYENGVYTYYEHEKIAGGCHGTGDVYASAFVGALVRGKTAYAAAKIAADYTVACIRHTATLDNHWYGAAFEPVLGQLIAAIEETK